MKTKYKLGQHDHITLLESTLRSFNCLLFLINEASPTNVATFRLKIHLYKSIEAESNARQFFLNQNKNNNTI